MRAVIVALCVLSARPLAAQTTVWQPAPGHTQVPIWPGTPPDARPAQGPEQAVTRPKDHLVAGRPWTYVQNVSTPTMTVYAPTGTNTGAAVVVFPGGGYNILAIDLEGSEVCDWVTARGITCVLLKYRVPHSGPQWDSTCRCQRYPERPMAVEDAQRTLGLVRLHAAEWHVDPHRIGVLGFSAGGHLAAAMSTQFERRLYPPVDAADRESCRPDFAVVLYPGHLWVTGSALQLHPSIHVTRETPPTFLVQAENDNVDNVNQSLTYYIALKDAGVPTELHLFAEGRHAFGLRRTNFPITDWPQLMEKWLGTIGMIPPQEVPGR
jgi:acetyl esterase/lipase